MGRDKCDKAKNRDVKEDAMADISKEIQDFRESVYGEEVRGSMISLAEKVNADGEQALGDVTEAIERSDQAVTTANAASESAQQAVADANTATATANEVNRQSAGNVTAAQSWATGGTGTRQDEDQDNSKYYSQQSHDQADRSETQANRSETEADRAARYASIVAPGFYVDPETMALYIKAGVGVDFIVSENDLCWKVS